MLLAACLLSPSLWASSWVASPPYRLFSAPAIDISLDAASFRAMRGQPAYGDSGYSLLMRGDMAYMGSRLYLSGREGEHLQSARLTLERTDPESGLLGPFQATRVALGDVDHPYLPFGGGQTERGLLLSNLDLYQGFTFDRTEISGDARTGWLVELYRNDLLIDTQTVGVDGRYRFSNVELYLGDNRMRLLFIGPNGERREEERALYVGPGLLQADHFHYQLLLTEQDRQLFEFDSSERTPGRGRLLSRLELGISRGLSFGGGVQSYHREGARQLLLDYGLRLASSRFFTSVDFSRLQGGGLNYRGLLHAAFGDDFKLRAVHSEQRGYASELEWKLAADPVLGPTNPLLSRSSLSLDGKLLGVPVNLGGERLEHVTSTERRLVLGFSGLAADVSLYNSFHYQRSQVQGLAEEEDLYGNLQWSRVGYPYIMSGRLGYGLKPEYSIDEFYLSFQRILGEGRMVNLELANYPQNDSFTRLSLGLFWQFPKLVVSPRLSVDDQGGYLAYLYASFALEPPRPRHIQAQAPAPATRLLSADTQANYGAVLLRLFVDRNHNGRHDPGEPPVEGVRMDLAELKRGGETDAEGYLSLQRLPIYRLLSLLVDVDALAERGLQPVLVYPSLMPRAGRWLEMDVPVREAR